MGKLGNVNIVGVAERAGVSISTVSRVLNDTSYPVKPETRKKVEQAIKELGYRPNHLARGLLLKKTSTIGLVIPDIANPYYPGLSRGVEDVASEHQHNIIFCNTDRDTEKSKHYINALIEKRVDGIIIAGGGTDFSEEVSTFSQFNTKIILIGRHNLAFPSVQVDNVQAAHDATSHLAQLGHHHIAFISGPSMLTSVQDRLAGYRLSLAEYSIAGDDRLIYEGNFTEESGYAAVQSLFAGAVKPTAIFATNDRMALGAMAAAIDLGLGVPQDLALVGFDNIIMASYVRPALTTVAIPTYEIGATAMQLMLKSLAGEKVPNTVHISTNLIIRESSGLKP